MELEYYFAGIKAILGEAREETEYWKAQYYRCRPRPEEDVRRDVVEAQRQLARAFLKKHGEGETNGD